MQQSYQSLKTFAISRTDQDRLTFASTLEQKQISPEAYTVLHKLSNGDMLANYQDSKGKLQIAKYILSSS